MTVQAANHDNNRSQFRSKKLLAALFRIDRLKRGTFMIESISKLTANFTASEGALFLSKTAPCPLPLRQLLMFISRT